MLNFHLIEDGLEHIEAKNRAFQLRRGQARNITAFGCSGFKRHLYRIGKTKNGYGIYVRERNNRQY